MMNPQPIHFPMFYTPCSALTATWYLLLRISMFHRDSCQFFRFRSMLNFDFASCVVYSLIHRSRNPHIPREGCLTGDSLPWLLPESTGRFHCRDLSTSLFAWRCFAVPSAGRIAAVVPPSSNFRHTSYPSGRKYGGCCTSI